MANDSHDDYWGARPENRDEALRILRNKLGADRVEWDDDHIRFVIRYEGHNIEQRRENDLLRMRYAFGKDNLEITDEGDVLFRPDVCNEGHFRELKSRHEQVAGHSGIRAPGAAANAR